MSPLIPLTGAWLLGLWCAPFAGLASSPWPAILGASWAGWRILQPEHGPLATARIRLVLCLLAGCAGLCRATPPAIPQAQLPAGWCLVDGYVEHSQRRASGSFLQRLRVEGGRLRATGRALPTGIALDVGPFPMPEGAHVRALMVVTPILHFRNPSPHPPWPGSESTYGRGRLPDPAAFRVLTYAPLPALLGQFRSAIRSALYLSLPPVHGRLAAALVLGDRSAIDSNQRAEVNQAGLAHLLAVSGLHVTMIGGLLVNLAKRVGLRCRPLAARWDVGRIAYTVGIPVALTLGPLCGGSPSARRAALTVAIGWSVRSAGRRGRASASAALAVLVLSALQPELGIDPGFLLSTLATAALLHTSPSPPSSFSHPASPLGQWLRQGIAATLATTLATLPIVIWCFGQLPLTCLAANLLVMPVFSYGLLPLCVLHAGVAVLLPIASPCTSVLVSAAAELFLNLLRLFGSLLPAYPWPPPSRIQGLLLVLAVGGAFLLRSRRHRLLLALAVTLAAMGSEWLLRRQAQPSDGLRITFLDVGQGDSALLDLPSGALMLIDAGGDPWGSRDPGKETLLPLLRARRRSHIDVVVLTHPHPDHFSGLDALAEQVTIGEIWDNGQARREREITGPAHALAQRLDQWAAVGTRIREASSLCEPERQVGGALIQVLWPCPSADPTLSENNNSLALRVHWGRFSALFTGDMEREAELALMARMKLERVDVLKVGHHGSRTSSHAAWLGQLQPRIAVISRGPNNRFGHPHPEVLSRLRRVGARVVDLAKTGGTMVTFGEHELTLRSWSGRRLWLPVRGTMRAEAPPTDPVPEAEHSVESSP